MPTYYIDYTNGLDTPVGTNANWGKREPTTGHYHSDGVCDDTHTICSSLPIAVNDGYNSAFLYNRTRGAGALVTDYDGGTKQLTHGAIAGNANGDEIYLIQHWKTTGKAATTMSAGDTCYVRAGLTETLAAVVNFTNDGTSASRIYIIGTGTGSATLETTDETATEMWHDASTTRPIIDGNNLAYYVYVSSDDYWTLQNLDVRNTNSSTYGCVCNNGCYSLTLNNCVMRDQASSSGENLTTGISGATSKGMYCYNCAFINSNGNNVDLSYNSSCLFEGCTFDSGALGTPYGISTGTASAGEVYLTKCTFGGTSPHLTNDIYDGGGMNFFTRDCVFHTAHSCAMNDRDYGIFEENTNGVYGSYKITNYHGTITKDTSVTRTGGASSSAKLMPNTYCNTFYSLTVNGRAYTPDFSVYCEGGVPVTISIYIRSVTTWGGSYPTASELWTETEYITDDTTEAITRTTANSTQTLSDATTWVAFNCGEITPHVSGWVNVKVKLAKYTASNGIYVDIKPVVTIG